MNTYRKGRRGEKRAALKLKARGYNYVRLTPGSRGPYDVSATSPRGNRAYVQVKSGTAHMDKKAKKRLKKYAKERHGIAVYARENRGKVRFHILANFAKRKKRRSR